MAEKNIKIGYFIDRLILGGTELQVVEQINLLSKKGIAQELFCLYKSVEHDNIDISCKVTILNVKKLFSIDCIRKLYRLAAYLKTNSFNIVQTYFFDSTIIGILAAKKAGGLRTISCRRDLGFWYTPFLLFCLKIINRMTDRILVNSTAVKETIIRKEHLLPGCIDIMPNGIDIKQFQYLDEEKKKNRQRWSIADDELSIGMMANMSRKVKRVDVFLKAAQIILKKTPKTKFIILGDGELKAELINMAKDLGIGPNVLFLSSDISKHSVLSALDIGVLTSDSEGLSNAIMEYMASGLPVVATEVGGNLDLVKNNKTGFLVDQGDFETLADRIMCLVSDQEKRSKFGLKGREHITAYDWESTAETIITYYKRELTL